MPKRAKEPIGFPFLGRREILNRVSELAKETFNIHWTKHALERMEEREITMRQALSTLRLGHIEGDPEPDEDGGWKLVLARRSAGSPVRVVVSLDDDELYVVTVM